MKYLIVDDDPGIVTFMAQVASSEGYINIEKAYSGEDALTHAIQESFNLITLDIMMPGVSGLEIVPLLRNMNPHAIIAIVSAHIPEEITSDISGCIDVMLSKPINLDTLLTLFQHAHNLSKSLEEVKLMSNLCVSLE